MMHRTVLLCFAALFVATSYAMAEDFWIKKDYTQWTDEEVKKVMTNSPWAKDVLVSASGFLGGQRPPSDSDSTEESGGGGRGGRGRGRGGGGGGGSAETMLNLNMSWRSALPLRKALVRSRVGAGAPIPPEAQQLVTQEQGEYVIVVSGVPARSARAIQNPAELGKSMLKIGKKSPVAAKAFDVQARTQTADVIFVFPKTEPIVAEDKEVEVVLRLGQVEVRKKFNLKEMVYNGKLEL